MQMSLPLIPAYNYNPNSETKNNVKLLNNILFKNIIKQRYKHNNQLLRSALVKLPFELAWDIWHRYYTYVVLDEILQTDAALKAQVFDCNMIIMDDYTFMQPDEQKYYITYINNLLKSGEHEHLALDLNIDGNSRKSRRRHWTTELC